MLRPNAVGVTQVSPTRKRWEPLPQFVPVPLAQPDARNVVAVDRLAKLKFCLRNSMRYRHVSLRWNRVRLTLYLKFEIV